MNRMTHWHRQLAALLMGLAGSLAWAQNSLDNPDWTEEKAGSAPAFSKTDLIPIEMPPHITVRFGVDPNTIRSGDDGVVRYVVVMTNATGLVSAAYEGIRCFNADFKTYARWSGNGPWVNTPQPEWRRATSNMGSPHAFAIARQGACDGFLARNTDQVIHALRNGVPQKR